GCSPTCQPRRVDDGATRRRSQRPLQPRTEAYRATETCVRPRGRRQSAAAASEFFARIAPIRALPDVRAVVGAAEFRPRPLARLLQQLGLVVEGVVPVDSDTLSLSREVDCDYQLSPFTERRSEHPTDTAEADCVVVVERARVRDL